MKFLRLFSGIGLMILFSSCESRHDRGAPSVDSFATTAVDFPVVRSKIFNSHCISCHQQYESYDGVRREIDAIASAIGNNRMPKGGPPLSTELKLLLEEWIVGGVPERAGEAPAPVDAILRPEWSSIYDNIVAPKCLACHNPSGQAKFLDLSTRDAIFKSREKTFGSEGTQKLIDFDVPENSYLIGIVQDEVEPMPPHLVKYFSVEP